MWFALLVLGVAVKEVNGQQCSTPKYRPGVDLLALHYDHAPDKDDGHSAALDRTIIDSTVKKGCKSQQFKKRLNAVSGTYGNRVRKGGDRPNWFDDGSNAVMNAAFGDCGGWVKARKNWNEAVRKSAKKWKKALKNGGRVFVKEGGPSEFTAAVIRKVKSKYPWLKYSKCKVIVVQHSNWNENQTDEKDLKYVKKNANYVRIKDANPYLRVAGDNGFINKFKNRALKSKFAKVWRAAFKYYSVVDWGKKTGEKIVDASDTGELMKIMGLGQMSLSKCMNKYF